MAVTLIKQMFVIMGFKLHLRKEFRVSVLERILTAAISGTLFLDKGDTDNSVTKNGRRGMNHAWETQS